LVCKSAIFTIAHEKYDQKVTCTMGRQKCNFSRPSKIHFCRNRSNHISKIFPSFSFWCFWKEVATG